MNKPAVAYFTSPLTQNSYLLNTSKADRMEAESSCIEWGGHLVSYTSKEEQNDVGCWGGARCPACCCVLPVLWCCAFAAAGRGAAAHALACCRPPQVEQYFISQGFLLPAYHRR